MPALASQPFENVELTQDDILKRKEEKLHAHAAQLFWAGRVDVEK